MTITVAGKTLELTDCQFLDHRHCNLLGHPWCGRFGRYVKAEKTAKRPEGCKCQGFVVAVPQKELAVKQLDLAYKFVADASKAMCEGNLDIARMSAKNAGVAIDKAFENIGGVVHTHSSYNNIRLCCNAA